VSQYVLHKAGPILVVPAAEQAAAEGREQVGRARVDLRRPGRGELVTADAARQAATTLWLNVTDFVIY
jgi:hypothetical protein